VVAGSHLSTDPVERPAQATILKKQLSEVDGRVVFAADLNENAAGASWRILAEGMTDAGAEVDLPTFSCASPRDRIDALFVDPRVEVRRYEVVDSAEARRASDHFPIVADLVVPE
jgi:endonuclease/exonuclease/phosphatase family metal-dependent hydrolase